MDLSGRIAGAAMAGFMQRRVQRIGVALLIVAFVLGLVPGARSALSPLVAAADTSGNQVVNPGFESSLGGTVVSCSGEPQSVGAWEAFTQTGGTLPQLVGAPSPVHSGSQSAEVHTPSGSQCVGGFVYQDFPNFPGSTTYQISGWAYPAQGEETLAAYIGWNHLGSALGLSNVQIFPDHVAFSAWGQTATGPAVAYNTWHQVSLIADASTLTGTLYIDNAKVGTTAAGTSLPTAELTLVAGQDSGSSSGDHFYWDDIGLYTGAQAAGGALTPAEATAATNPAEPATCHCLDQQTTKPIDTAFGNFWHSFTDLSIPGRGPGLAWSRTYSSTLAANDGPLGFGWSGGALMSLSQDASGTTATVHQEDGSQVAFTAAGAGTYWAAPRVVATLRKNGDGTFTYTRRAKTRFTFSASGQLTAVADLNGNTVTFTYSAGQLAGISDGAGRSLTITDTGSHITKVVDPGGRQVLFGYNDGNGDLTDVTDVAGGSWHFTYDASHRLLTMTDPRGGVVTNDYDASGRVDWQKDALGRKTAFAYAGGTVTVTDPKGNVTVDTYANSLLTSQTRGAGSPSAATWQYSYDPGTLALVAVTDPNGHVRTMTYDASGNLLVSTDALHRQTVNTYDSLDDLTSTTDPKGVTTTLSYDAAGNLTQVSTPLVGSSPAVSRTTAYAHTDPSHPGDVTAVTDADGKSSHFAYDTAGNLASSADPLGDTATYTYNTIGWMLTSVAPKGNVAGCGCATSYTTAYGHDSFGQVTTTTDPLGHVTTRHYDGDGNLDRFTDGDGNLTTYVHDAANELTAVDRADTPQTSLVTDYNPDGTVLDQKDGAGDTTTYGYDPLARVTSVTTPPTAACPTGCVTTSSYDGAGNRLTTVDPAGATTTYAYDAADELTGITYSGGTTPNVSAITYDADGQRTAMTDGTGTSTWTWDSLHRLLSYTNGAGASVAYDYTTPSGAADLLDRLGHITYPGGVGTIARSYDDAGRLATLADWNGRTFTFGYDANSNLVSSTTPSSPAVTDTTGLDAADEVTSMATSNGATLFSSVYARDGNGQVTSDSSVPSVQGAYAYTSLNQLCYAGSSATAPCSTPPAGSQPFAYDAADNLTLLGGTVQKFDAASELCWTSPSPSSNPCATAPAGGTSYGYDTLGERTSVVPPTGVATCYRYDQASRLTGVVSGTGSTCTTPATVATYTYDGGGLRQSRTVGGATMQFTWDVAGSLPMLLQEKTTGVTTSYLYGPGGLPLEQMKSSEPSVSMVGVPVTAADSTGTGGPLTLTLPSGVTAGDQIILATTYPAALGNSAAAPTGYSAVGTPASSGGVPLTADVTSVFHKTATANEGPITLSYSGVFPKAAVVAVYRGADPGMPIEVSALGADPGGTTVDASLTTHSADRLVVIQGASYVATAPGTWSAPAGSTEAAQRDATLVTIGLADSTQSSGGATGTLTSSFTTTGTFAAPPQLTAVLLALQSPAGVTFFHHDQLGSTRLLTDVSGAPRGSFTYDPYGNLISTPATTTVPFLFAGQYRDADSGLSYLRARYYDPATAQFLTRDPAVAKTHSAYGYSWDNPLNGADPSGLDAWGGDNPVSDTLNGIAIGADGACGADAAIPGLDAATCAAAGISDLFAGVSDLVNTLYEPSWFEDPSNLQCDRGGNGGEIAWAIAHGHAWGKHWTEFWPIVKNADQFAGFIRHVITNSSDFKALHRGRAAFWDDASGTIVIIDPNRSDLGTAFRPAEGKEYFDNQVESQLDAGMWDG